MESEKKICWEVFKRAEKLFKKKLVCNSSFIPPGSAEHRPSHLKGVGAVVDGFEITIVRRIYSYYMAMDSRDYLIMVSHEGKEIARWVFGWPFGRSRRIENVFSRIKRVEAGAQEECDRPAKVALEHALQEIKKISVL